MEEHLTFERLIQYDPGQPGITLDVSLSLSAASVNFPAKVDTGASYCVFERRRARRWGLASQAAFHSRSAQFQAVSLLMATKSHLAQPITISIQ